MGEGRQTSRGTAHVLDERDGLSSEDTKRTSSITIIGFACRSQQNALNSLGLLLGFLYVMRIHPRLRSECFHRAKALSLTRVRRSAIRCALWCPHLPSCPSRFGAQAPFAVAGACFSCVYLRWRSRLQAQGLSLWRVRTMACAVAFVPAARPLLRPTWLGRLPVSQRSSHLLRRLAPLPPRRRARPAGDGGGGHSRLWPPGRPSRRAPAPSFSMVAGDAGSSPPPSQPPPFPPLRA